MSATNNNCGNCNFFTENTEEVTPNKFIHDCIGFGICDHPKLIDDLKTPCLIDRSCIISTCDEQRSCLSVGINFGCIHFEQNEQ